MISCAPPVTAQVAREARAAVDQLGTLTPKLSVKFGLAVSGTMGEMQLLLCTNAMTAMLSNAGFLALAWALDASARQIFTP